MFIRDHVKKLSSGGAFWRNCYSKEIFAQTFFADFPSHILLRIFFWIFLRGFSFEYFLADFLSNIFSRIFFRIIFRGFSFEYSFKYSITNFFSNILSRIFFQIFFHGVFFQYSFSDFLSNNLCGLSFIYGYAGPCKNQLTVVLSDGIVTQRRFSLKHSSWIFILILFRWFSF